jgi:hypothetical protein
MLSFLVMRFSEMSNQQLEATPVGAFSSAIAVDALLPGVPQLSR